MSGYRFIQNLKEMIRWQFTEIFSYHFGQITKLKMNLHPKISIFTCT